MTDDRPPLAARLKTWWRAIPVDVVALLAITVAIVVTHHGLVRRGACFNDPSWYFHFGRRVVNGDVPYRDFVFQVGPLPIYIDAAFQEIFGSKYLASVYAGLFIKILRMLVVWMVARRIAGRWAAGILLVFCGLDPIFAFAHNWSLSYSQLFITLAGLFCLLAVDATGRRELVYLALVGANAALVVTARQSSAVMIGVVLIAATTVMLIRRNYFTKQRYLALWGGFAASLVVVFGFLAVQGALGPAIQQMFIDAPAKKGIHGIDAILDAISGGALVVYLGDPSYSWWSGFLVYIGLPCALVVFIGYVASRKEPVTPASIAMLILPAGVVYTLATREASLSFWGDAPRTFFTATSALAVLAPERTRRWLGLEPLVALGLGALPLASDWALEMSFPGRGWGDAMSLTIGVILFALASKHISRRAKTIFCSLIAAASLMHVVIYLRHDLNPFAKDEAMDGTLKETTVSSANAILRGIRINEGRKKFVDWINATVMPGSTCFVYANMPTIYDIAGCNNPTRIDSTTADFIGADDAEAAIAILKADPPQYLIAHDNTWMNPPLNLDLHDDPAQYGGMNPKASMVMHIGLRSLLDQYEQIGYSGDVLGPELSKQSSTHWDTIQVTRIYRRKY